MSPKNKGKFGKGKPEPIPQTDEFISGVDRVLRALKPHALRLAVLFGVVAVVVVGYTGYRWWNQRGAAAATEMYVRAVALSQVPVSEEAPEAKDAPPDPRNLPTHFKTRADRARAVLSALDEVADEHGSTGPGRQAQLLAADALYELGRYGEAAQKYQAYIDGGGPEELVLTAREGLAYALEAKAVAEKDASARQAGLQKALAAFEAMQPKTDGPRRDEALFHQGRLLSETGRTAEAVARFEKILSEHPSSTLKEDVELRLLALKGPSKPAKASSPAP